MHNWKYAPVFQVLKRLLDGGTIGTPTYVELTTLRTKPAGTSGWRVDPQLAGVEMGLTAQLRDHGRAMTHNQGLILQNQNTNHGEVSTVDTLLRLCSMTSNALA